MQSWLIYTKWTSQTRILVPVRLHFNQSSRTWKASAPPRKSNKPQDYLLKLIQLQDQDTSSAELSQVKTSEVIIDRLIRSRESDSQGLHPCSLMNPPSDCLGHLKTVHQELPALFHANSQASETSGVWGSSPAKAADSLTIKTATGASSKSSFHHQQFDDDQCLFQDEGNIFH